MREVHLSKQFFIMLVAELGSFTLVRLWQLAKRPWDISLRPSAITTLLSAEPLNTFKPTVTLLSSVKLSSLLWAKP